MILKCRRQVDCKQQMLGLQEKLEKQTNSLREQVKKLEETRKDLAQLEEEKLALENKLAQDIKTLAELNQKVFLTRKLSS